MTHNTITVYYTLKRRYPFLKSISYFNDGSSAQCKNYKNFTHLLMHKIDFGMKAEWYFFATSHGKNACDGAVGTVKRLVVCANLQRAIHKQILNPHQLCE